jgi:hypothetical protein
LRLVNIGEALRQADAALAHEGSYAKNPAAIGAVMVLPQVSAIDGGCGFQDFREFGIEASVAEFLLGAGKVGAILEVAELALEYNQVPGKKQVFVGEVGGVVRDAVFPGAPLRVAETVARIGERRRGGLGGLVALCRQGRALARLLVQRVMKVQPEATVKFKNGKLPIACVDLRTRCDSRCHNKQGGQLQRAESCQKWPELHREFTIVAPSAARNK